jgi:type IV secretory pathway VirB2 component (pilin)
VLLEVLMPDFPHAKAPSSNHRFNRSRPSVSRLFSLVFLLLIPLAAHAQGSPFDNGFTALQTLFTGTVAKVASLIAIVIGGYQFAHGEPVRRGNLQVVTQHKRE